MMSVSSTRMKRRTIDRLGFHPVVEPIVPAPEPEDVFLRLCGRLCGQRGRDF